MLVCVGREDLKEIDIAIQQFKRKLQDQQQPYLKTVVVEIKEISPERSKTPTQQAQIPAHALAYVFCVQN